MNRLPSEILQKIFQEAPPKQSYNFAFVCRSWAIPAQAVLFSHVTIASESQLRKFNDTITHSPSFGIKVKTIQLQFSLDIADTIFANLLLNCLPNLEEFTEGHPLHYIHTLIALSNSKLKYLRRLQIPSDSIDGQGFQNYVDCAFLMKDRLENICISDSPHQLDLRRETIKESRLYKELNLFQKLKVINIQVFTNNEIEVLEHVVEKCRTVKDIEFSFQPIRTEDFHLPPTNNDITAATMSKYIPITTIKSVKCSLREPNPHKLVLYIMHKYPQLDNLDILFDVIRSLRLDMSAVTNFLDYIDKIPTFLISDFTLKQNILADGILKFGLRNMKICYTEISFNGTNYIVDISRKSSKQAASTSLRYVGFAVNFRWKMYMDYMEKGGEFIDDLRFKFLQNSSTVGPFNYIAPDNFIPYIFTQCPHLQHLHFKACTLERISCTDIDVDEKYYLDKLSFEKCVIYDGILEKMSGFIHQIHQLKLSAVTYKKEATDKPHNSVISVNMPNTTIKNIMIGGVNLGESVHVKISTSTDGNDCYYYQFNLADNRYSKYASNEENYSSNDGQHIYIRCQTHPNIKLIAHKV